MKTINRILCTAVASAALLGVSGLAAVASASTPTERAAAASEVAPEIPTSDDGTVITPIDPRIAEQQALGIEDDTVRAQATRGFDVTNLSGNELVLAGFKGNDSSDELPAIGSVIAPGGTGHFEIAWKYPLDRIVTAEFHIVGPNGQDKGAYWASMRVRTVMFWTEQSSFAMHGSAGAVWGEGQQQFYGDAKDTVIDVPAAQAQEQADVMNRMCASGEATCSFTPKVGSNGKLVRDTEAWTGWHQIGTAWGSDRSTPYSKEFIASETVELTQGRELGATVSAKVAGIFEATVNGKVTDAVRTSREFSDKTTLKVMPGTMTWPEGNFPVITDTGDFTVTMGNTTWNLRGVTFVHPDPKRHGKVIWREAPVDEAANVNQIPEDATVIDTSVGF